MHTEKCQWVPHHGSSGISNLVFGHSSKGLDEQDSNPMHVPSLNFINHIRIGEAMLSLHNFIEIFSSWLEGWILCLNARLLSPQGILKFVFYCLIFRMESSCQPTDGHPAMKLLKVLESQHKWSLVCYGLNKVVKKIKSFFYDLSCCCTKVKHRGEWLFGSKPGARYIWSGSDVSVSPKTRKQRSAS